MSCDLVGCGCPICMPGTARTDSPSLQPKPSSGVDIDLAHVVDLFKQLDDRHRALTIALMTAGIRLQGKR